MKEITFEQVKSICETSEETSIENGVPDNQVFNFDVETAKYILKRLILFRDSTNSYIACEVDDNGKINDTLSHKKTRKILNKMIDAFYLYLTEDDIFDKTTNKKIKKGFKAFIKYYWSLWD